MRQPKKDHAAPKQKKSAVEYIWEERGCMQQRREPIVRCRDCKHGYKADLSGNWYECMKPDGNGDYARWDVEPDGFCAWGERRDA